MSWTKEVTIWCDKCTRWDQSHKTRAMHWRDMKRKGWTEVGRNLHRCPICSIPRVPPPVVDEWEEDFPS